jgi:hypothetical protein
VAHRKLTQITTLQKINTQNTAALGWDDLGSESGVQVSHELAELLAVLAIHLCCGIHPKADAPPGRDLVPPMSNGILPAAKSLRQNATRDRGAGRVKEKGQAQGDNEHPAVLFHFCVSTEADVTF